MQLLNIRNCALVTADAKHSSWHDRKNCGTGGTKLSDCQKQLQGQQQGRWCMGTRGKVGNECKVRREQRRTFHDSGVLLWASQVLGPSMRTLQVVFRALKINTAGRKTSQSTSRQHNNRHGPQRRQRACCCGGNWTQNKKTFYHAVFQCIDATRIVLPSPYRNKHTDNRIRCDSCQKISTIAFYHLQARLEYTPPITVE